MAGTVTDGDLRGLLDVVDAARSGEPDDLPGLPAAMLEQLCRLVACDSLTFLDLDPGRHTVLVEQEYRPDDGAVEAGAETDVADHDPAAGPDTSVDEFWRNYDACLGCSYPSISGDSRSVTTMSDFYSQREYHSTGMYAEYLGPLGFEYEAMLCLPAPASQSRRLVFFRSGRTDFDGRERLLLALLRPHLAEVDRELSHRRHVGATLTPRQYELLRLVARGDSNIEIACTLAISPATVRKHLEHIFDRLGVMSRTAAVAKALSPEHIPA